MMPAGSRALMTSLSCLLALAALTLINMPTASAQDATYTVVVRDITAKSKDSKNVTPVLIEALEANEDLKVISGEEGEDALKASKMSDKDWRSSAKIEKNQERIEGVTKKNKIDAIALVEVQKRGKIMSVTLLNAQGQELKTFRGGLKKKTLKDDQAEKAAGAIYKLIKSSIEPRKKEEPKAAPNTNVAMIDEPDPTPAADPKATATNETEVSSNLETPALLDNQLIVNAGLAVGRRDLSSTSKTVELKHVAPFIGPMLRVMFTRELMDGDAQLGVSANFAYGPFNTDATDTDGKPVSLASSLMRGGAALSFHYGLSDSFALGVYGGADYLIISIDPNEFYTGHRYISARTGLSALISPTDGVYISLEGGVLPYVSGQYQTPENETANPSPFGFDAGGSLALRLTDAIEARLLYQLTYMQPSDSDPAEATDIIHQGGLMVGYGF